MEAKIGFAFTHPFRHVGVMDVKVKWRRLSPYAYENKDKNFGKFFDAVREAIQGSISEMKALGVTGNACWVYDGFLADYVFKKLKESDGVLNLKMEKGRVIWSSTIITNKSSSRPIP